MSEKEWEDAYRKAIEQGRARVGAPPTPDEMMAYARGTLGAHEENRIRELLAYYPDLAEALTEEAEPSNAGPPYLSEHQLAQDWKSLQNRLKESAPGDPDRVWQWTSAAAALVCVVLGGLYFQSLRQLSDLRDELRSPRVDVERVPLYERNVRGGGDPMSHQLQLLPTTRYVSLNLTLAAEPSARDFRVAMIDLDTPSPRTVWTSRIYRSSDGTFTLEVPRSFFTSTSYRVNLYADDGAKPVAEYLIRVMPFKGGTN